MLSKKSPWLTSLEKVCGDILAIFVLFLLTVLFFSKVFFSHKLYYIRDIYGVGYQWMHLIIETLQAGYMPLWNPYQLSGAPFLAHPATMSLYPLNTLLYLFDLNGLTYVYFIILQVFLAGVFLYALMRHWQCSPVPALLAALSYMFSGYFVSFAPNFVSPAVWLPLVFLFFDKAVSQRQKAESKGQEEVGGCGNMGGWEKSSTSPHSHPPTLSHARPFSRGSPLASILLAGGFLGLEFLTGGIEVGFFTILALGLYPWFMGLGIRKNWLKSLAIGCGILILVMGMGVSLAMVQFLPSWELVSESARSKGLDYEAAGSHPLHPATLIEFFVPHFFGKKTDVRFWGESFYDNHYAYFISIYFGISSIMLAILAVAYLPNKLIFYLFILLTLSVVLALGPYTPVHYLVYQYVPLMGSSRIPVKYIALTTFAAAALVGFGSHFLLTEKVEACRQKAKSRRPIAYSLPKWIGLFFLSLGLLLGIFLLIDYLNHGSLLQIAFGKYVSQEKLMEATSYVHKEVFKSFVFLLAGAFVIVLTAASKLSLRTSGTLMVFIVTMDLFLAHMHLHPTVPEPFYSEQPVVINLFDKGREGFEAHPYYRFYRYSHDVPEVPDFVRDDPFKRYSWFKNTLFPYYSVQHHLYDAAGTFALRPMEYGLFLHAIDIAPPPERLRLLSLLNVRYILSFAPLKDEGLKPIAFFPDLKMGVYENVTYLPRVYFVSQSRIARGRVDALNTLISGGFDPEVEVVLQESGVQSPESDVPLTRDSGLRTHTEESFASVLKITDYHPTRVKIEAYVTQRGYLVFTDTHYPGWRAYVDGQNTQILRANYLFRSIPLEPGQHMIQFKYEPSSYKTGLFVSLITLMGWVSFFVTYLKRT